MPREYFPLPTDGKFGDFWNGYLRTKKKNSGNRYYAKCTFCEKEDIEGRNIHLTKHKAECSKRNSWPEHLRLTKKPPEIPKDQNAITGFVEPIPRFNQDIANDKLLLALVSVSTPFTFVNDPYVREFFDYLGVKIPDRDTLRSLVMTKVLEDVRQEQKHIIALAKYINIIIDGWTDTGGIYYVAVLLVFDSTCQYIGNLHFGNGRHTADVIAKELLTLVKEYVPDMSRVVSIVTDSANVMKCTKKIIAREIQSITPLPCVLHVLNLVSKDVVNHSMPEMKDMKNGATTVSTFFRKSHYWGNFLKDWGEEKKVSGVIKSHCETRWFSFFDMCESISLKEEWFKSVFGLTPEGLKNRKQVSKEVHKYIIDSKFFSTHEGFGQIFWGYRYSL